MKGKRSLIAVMSAATALAFTGTAAADGPIAHWRFDEGSGASAADSSGNGLTATLNGGTSWVPGKRFGALRFDGATGVAGVASDPLLAPARVTVSTWVKRAGSPGDFKYIVGKGALGCLTASYGLYSGPNGGIAFYVSDGPGYGRTEDGGTGIWDGTWHHVAGSFDGQLLRLYIDGAEVGTGIPWATPINYAAQTAADLLMGNYGGCSGLGFDGDIDETKIWGRALTPAEVQGDTRFFDFSGFFSPVDNVPTVNVVKAGSAVPIKFSLAGYQGMNILAAGSPGSSASSCTTSATDQLEETASAGESGLSYDATTDRYHYVWKTEKAWAGQCRTFTLKLSDGTTKSASFRFSK